MKTKTITLKFLNDDQYKIIKVTDSVEFSPGSYISKAATTGLCRSPEWKVVITE